MKKKKLNYKERQFKRELRKNEIITGAVSIFFIALTAVYPLFIWFSKYEDLTREKTLFFWFMTGISTLGIVSLLFAAKGSIIIRDYYAEDEPKRSFSVAEWAVTAFITLTFISAFVSVIVHNFGGNVVWYGQKDRFEGFISFLCYAVNFMIIARYYKPKPLHFLLLAGSAVLISLYGLMQFAGFDIFGLFPFYFERFVDGAGNSIYGPLSAYFRTTLGNVNIVSAYCSFAVILFAALFSAARSKWQYLYLAAAVMSFALFLLTGTSGEAGMVAITGAMVLLIPYWFSNRERLGRILIVLSGWCIAYAAFNAYLSSVKNKYETDSSGFAPYDAYFLQTYSHKNLTLFIILAAVLLGAGLCLLILLKKLLKNWNTRIMKIAGTALMCAVIVGGIVSVEIAGSKITDNPTDLIWQAREIMHGRFEDHFGSTRVWIWRNAVEVIPKHPILGTGPDTFYYALGAERHAESSARYFTTFDKAHNLFLQTAVCMGIPALIALLIFIGSLFISAVKKAFERPILLAFGGAALSYTIQSFFCVEVPITTPLLWVSLGVMASEIWMAKVGCGNIEI